MIFLRCYRNSKWPPEVDSNFFVGAKTLKLKVITYSNFTITFPTIWRCASDFLKVLLEFKMTAMDKLHIFLWAQKLQNEISSNSHCTITLPTIWKCACDFSSVKYFTSGYVRRVKLNWNSVNSRGFIFSYFD